jgi:hypothetical protein
VKTAHLVAATLVWALLTPSIGAAAPPDDAIAKYRDYVAAIREGQVEKVVKLVEPVPESCKPLLTASVESKIAVEAVKKEMTAQMGPPKPGDQAWSIGQPSDDLLKRLAAVAQDPNTVGLMVKEPQVSAGWMVRQKGQWVVPAAMVMDLPPAPKFTEPAKEEREQMLKYAQATAKAAEAVLKRLRNKEFKTPAEVQNALGEEMNKAAPEKGPAGEIDDGSAEAPGSGRTAAA